MRDFARQAIAAAVSAIALGCVGVNPAAAADIPIPQAQQPPPPPYYSSNPQEYVEEGYVYPPPPAVYVPARPAYGYYYGPPAVAVVPRPYYRRPYPGVVYGRPAYVARGYGPYGRHFNRGYRHW